MTDDQPHPKSLPLVASSTPTSLQAVLVLAAVAVVLAVTGLVLWMIQVIHDSNDRKATRSQFASVAVGLVTYSEFHGQLPYPVVRQGQPDRLTVASPIKEADRPLYSWRVKIVPYLAGWHGTWDPSQPWDHSINKNLLEMSKFYSYSVDGKTDTSAFPETNLLAIMGPGTAFGDGIGRPLALKAVPPATIIAVETRSSGIPWPAPGDFDIRVMRQTVNAPDGKGISSRNTGGFHLIFADGQVWFLSDKIPFETLRAFFTTADAGSHDREQLLGRYALHRGP